MLASAIESLIAFTLLMLVVLGLRTPIARFFGAEWAYALWLLPLLRLALPPFPFGAGELLFLIPPDAALIPAAGGSAASLPSADGLAQWVPLLALWAGGAAAFILWQAAAYRRFLKSLAVGMRPAAVPSYGGIRLFESEAVEGPFAVGILDRRIAVPPLFEYRYTAAEQQLALEHELVRHRRGDLVWNSLAQLALALNWFNPVAYFAFRAFRADQELACDAAVARCAPVCTRDQASALVKSASRPGEIAASALHAAQLKLRLRMMEHHHPTPARRAAGAAAVAILLTAGLGIGVPCFPREKGDQQVGNTILGQGEMLSGTLRAQAADTLVREIGLAPIGSR